MQPDLTRPNRTDQEGLRPISVVKLSPKETKPPVVREPLRRFRGNASRPSPPLL